MGKKGKVGKARKDKFYQLAKETGYRARSAFKLIQLNRKFSFLQNARVCIDLCAAPGGWCQVAAKFMPMSSIIVGVDLMPIRPIPNVITFCDDITSESCRVTLRKHLATWKADVVLNDGAPNVGQAWSQDAFSQAQLTLSAFKLAAEFLKEGGIFVTKIFRSKDYHSLLWVFQQHFLAPDKIDPKFFSYKSVFSDVAKETNAQKLNLINPVVFFPDPQAFCKKAVERVNSEKNILNRKREGYSDDASLSLHKTVSARQFIDSDSYLDLLSTAYTIELDDPQLNQYTSEDLKECLKDIKVLGKKEIRAIIKWRDRIRKAERAAVTEEETKNENIAEEEEEDVETKVEHQILELEAAEKAAKRQKKKRISKIKEKNLAKIAKGLDVPKEAVGLDEDPNLFNLTAIKTKKGLESVENQVEPTIEEEVDKEKSSKAETGKSDSDEESDVDGDGEEVESASEEDNEIQDEDEPENPLLIKTDEETVDKTNLWFSKIKDKLENDINDDVEDEEVETMATAYNVGKDGPEKDADVAMDEDEYESSESSSSDEEDYREMRKRKHLKEPSNDASEVEVVPVQKRHKALSAAELALGQQLVTSRKRRNEIMDDSYHRYSWGDEDIPDWFAEDERKFYRKQLPVTKEQVAEYRQQIREINARPIKKIAEAKAKAKYKTMKKLKKLSEQAEALGDDVDGGGQAEQVHKLKQMMKKVEQSKKKPETTYVVAKKMHGKHQKRPTGVKGRVKYVDPRMKKDTDGKKRAEQKKKGGRKLRIKNRIGHKPRSR